MLRDRQAGDEDARVPQCCHPEHGAIASAEMDELQLQKRHADSRHTKPEGVFVRQSQSMTEEGDPVEGEGRARDALVVLVWSEEVD